MNTSTINYITGVIKINGRIIPSNEVEKLPLGTKLLVHCLDDLGDWNICTIEKRGEILYLFDTSSKTNLTDIEELEEFCEVYEYDSEDAKRLIKEIPKPLSFKQPRYLFDNENMAILDTQKNQIVCLVETKRPDLLEKKLNELLELANR